jgi:hypothetical protein
MYKFLTKLVVLAALGSSGVGYAADETPYCGRNPFNRDLAEPLPIALSTWHCETCAPLQWERAGCPQNVRPHALPSNTRYYWGWWVGGGTALGGGPPGVHEGTWGWDYEGVVPKRVWLNWSHRRYQGGTGAYKTDGPKLHLHEE